MIVVILFDRTCTERQVGKSTLMTSALTLYEQDIVLKKEPRSHKKLRTMGNDILKHQQQNMLISSKRALKRPSSSRVLFERSREERKGLSLLDVEKARARKAEKFF